MKFEDALTIGSTQEFRRWLAQMKKDVHLETPEEVEDFLDEVLYGWQIEPNSYQFKLLQSCIEEVRQQDAPNSVEKFLASQRIQRLSDVGKGESWDLWRKARGFQNYEEYCEMKRRERE